MLAAIFSALVGVFALLLGMIFIPAVRESLKGPPFLIFLFTFFLLGAGLLFLAVREKPGKKLRKFLILTGASAVGFFVSAVLHNFLYAVEIVTKDFVVLSKLAGILHVVFFLVAVPICPLAFLVGVVGSLVLFIKKEQGGLKKK